MYLLNSLATVDWVLDKTSSVIALSDLSVIVVKPDGSTDILALGSLVPPTASEQGLATQTTTPDVVGLWSLTLIKGAAVDYVTLSKALMFVFSPKSTVYPIGYNPNSLAL